MCSVRRYVKSLLIVEFLFAAVGCLEQGSDVSQSAKVQSQSNPEAVETTSGSTEVVGGGSTVGVVLSQVRPALAVRGMNCVTCHSSVSSNIVTDFGYSPDANHSANFITDLPFFAGPGGAISRTAYNDQAMGGGIGGWQHFFVDGTVYVPQVTIPAAQAITMFKVNRDVSFMDVMALSDAPGETQSMIANVSGPAQVATASSVTIAYPSASEILNLLPSTLQSSPLAVAAIQVASVAEPSSISGLVIDASNQFVRNSPDSSVVVCYGDVVIKGPLFLQNLNVLTDGNGCRLYVSQTVFIQGPITEVGDPLVSNLQISSAVAIIIGDSAEQMGAASLSSSNQAPAVPSRNRTGDNVLTTPGGPWPRFNVGNDVQYNPSGAPINGVDSTAFFDGIVADALAIGPELQDAGDAAALAGAANNPAELVVSEPANPSLYTGCSLNRLSIDYQKILLNAPHVHNRYYGSFLGVVIAEVAMFARNPADGNQFGDVTFDPVFALAPYILPALSTNILEVNP